MMMTTYKYKDVCKLELKRGKSASDIPAAFLKNLLDY